MMSDAEGQLDLTRASGNSGNSISAEPLHLRVTFHLAAGEIGFEWAREAGPIVARGWLVPGDSCFPRYVLDWRMESHGKPRNNFCSAHASSVRAMLNRIRKIFPLAAEVPCLGLLPDTNLGPVRAGEFFRLLTPPGEDFWKQLGRDVLEFAHLLEANLAGGGDPTTRGRTALRLLTCARLGLLPDSVDQLPKDIPLAPLSTLLHLCVTIDQVKCVIELV